ncbi:MAG: hypothetical protein KME26_08345 [Oscillatoria princeps RMCB-10]|nr:hypothetical protein [Oscillatoria princeps RMCB-10]
MVETGSPLVKESAICPDADSLQCQSRFYDVRAAKQGEGLAVCWRDIPGRVLAERALRETTELLQPLVQASPIVIVAIDTGRNAHRASKIPQRPAPKSR